MVCPVSLPARPSGVALSHSTVEIVQMSLNVGDTWTMISDWTLGLVHPVDLTGTSGRPELGCSESLTALFRGDAYSSLSWPFALT